MYNIDIPISKEGRFEVAMFDIWLGTMLIEEQNIDIDYRLMQDRIEVYLKQIASKLGLPAEKKHERIYHFSQRGMGTRYYGFDTLRLSPNQTVFTSLYVFMYSC